MSAGRRLLVADAVRTARGIPGNAILILFWHKEEIAEFRTSPNGRRAATTEYRRPGPGGEA